MSYQVLARKWRPKTFRELAGQEHVLKALVNALDNNRLHHAYLFTGTRGVGKTTIARILAKCLNCEEGVSAEPCGKCRSCTEIAEGRFVDLIEVDAASRTKVEDTRELLENVQYAPTMGRYKVYLIDEVHMLSTHSFNALLKTLEEPPPHVKFLLATTDPQKLPATILSRCLQFNLKNMTPERIVEHLTTVLNEEKVTFDEQALWLLGRAADGSMRDAMSLTDQAIGFGNGEVLEADVRNMLGTIDQNSIYDLARALSQADGAALLATVDQMSEHAPDYVATLESLLSLFHRLAVAQAVPDAVDNSLGDQQQITELASEITAEDVQLFYQIGLNGRRDLPLVSDPRSGFEMTLLRMLAFKPADSDHVTETASEVPASVKKSRKPESSAAPAPAEPAAVEARQAQPKKSSAPKQTPSTTQAKSISSSLSEPAPKQPVDPVVIESAVASSAPEKSDADGQQLILSDLDPELWSEQFSLMGLGGVVGNIVSHCLLEKIESDVLFLKLDENNATLFNENSVKRIEEDLSKALQQAVRVIVNVAAVDAETPAARKTRVMSEQKQHAIELLEKDPNVRRLIEDFDATLDLDSVTPLH